MHKIWKYLTRLNWKAKDGYNDQFYVMGILPHTHTEPPPEGYHREVRADSNTADGPHPPNPTPTPPQQPRGEDCLLCSALPASVLGDVSAPALHDLPSVTDPVLQALLQGSSKSRVTLFGGRLSTEFTSSQRDLCYPRVQEGQPGSSLRVERPVLQMKAGAGSSCVLCENQWWWWWGSRRGG